MNRNILLALSVLLLAALCSAGCIALGAATVASGIVYYKSAHHESATVELQAKPDRVYQAALETISANPEVRIAKQDNAARMLELKHGKQSITVKVTALSATRTQLAVTSDVKQGEPGSTQAVLTRVGEICDKLGVKHYVVK